MPPPAWTFPAWTPRWLRRLTAASLDRGWALFGPFLGWMVGLLLIASLLLLAILIGQLLTLE